MFFVCSFIFLLLNRRIFFWKVAKNAVVSLITYTVLENKYVCMYLSFLMILSLSASHALIIPSRGITIVGVVMDWDSDMGWTWFFVISLEFFMVTILFSSSSNFCLSCSILVCNNTSANGIIKVNNNQASIILIDEVLGNLGKDQKGQYENVLNGEKHTNQIHWWIV